MNPIKNGIVTTPFFEMRPLSVPVKERTHIHGALDIAPQGDNNIYAPFDCLAFAWWAKRDSSSDHYRVWPKLPEINGKPFEWCNYFYDMYGGVIVLKELNSINNVIRTHLICHCWQNQLFNKPPFSNATIKTKEQPENSRYAISAIYTSVLRFQKGDVIGQVGNAGYSTGAHIHWEIHPGEKWIRYEDRINPEIYL